MRSITHMRFLVHALVVLIAAAGLAADEITPERVIAEMNVYRAAAGLPALRQDPRLLLAADDRMRDMEELGYWSHVSPDGRSPFLTIRGRGYDYQSAGENLASGFDTVEVLVQSWMESKGHRDNILSPFYRDCGIAIIDGATTGRASGRSVVVLFARPRFVEPPAVQSVAPLEPLKNSSRK